MENVPSSPNFVRGVNGFLRAPKHVNNWLSGYVRRLVGPLVGWLVCNMFVRRSTVCQLGHFIMDAGGLICLLIAVIGHYSNSLHVQNEFGWHKMSSSKRCDGTVDQFIF